MGYWLVMTLASSPSTYMRYFVLEARAKDGKKYLPTMIRCILNRIYKESKAPFSKLDKADPAFQELHLTLDRVTSDLHREGIGVSKKSAVVIPFEHENLFWEKQLLGYSTLKVLQRAGSLFSIFPLFSTWWHFLSKPLIVGIIITDSSTAVLSTTFVVTVFPLML